MCNITDSLMLLMEIEKDLFWEVWIPYGMVANILKVKSTHMYKTRFDSNLGNTRTNIQGQYLKSVDLEFDKCIERGSLRWVVVLNDDSTMGSVCLI